MSPQRTRGARVRTATFAVALSTAAVPVLSMPGASASERSMISYSADGVNYAGAVPELFASSPKLAPGERIDEVLWVRNGYPMAVTVGVIAANPVETGGTALVGIAPSDTTIVEPGTAAAINVAVLLPEEAGNATQVGSWAVRLQVTVVEVVPPKEGELSLTGVQGWLWLAGMAALLGGAGVFEASRKRRGEL